MRYLFKNKIDLHKWFLFKDKTTYNRMPRDTQTKLSAKDKKKLYKGFNAVSEERLKIERVRQEKRREAAEAFDQAGRADKAAQEKAEGEIIGLYLPKQLSDDEISALIAECVAAVGAAGPQDMGKVMGALKPKIAGKADGGKVSALVKAALNK